MPILDVDLAKQVIVIKRSMSPGYAGIANPLFIKRNEELIETSKKNLRRLRVEDAFVNSRKVLFRKYYKADEIVKTMKDVLNLAKAIK